MSAPRARANHALYLARIVLGAWQRELDRQEIPASTVSQAFHESARAHLVSAYGWFLLAVSQAEPAPGGPPRCCDELSPLPPGKVFPGEINEFRRLETDGWLHDMLQPRAIDPPGARRQDNLAVAASDVPGTDQLAQWLRQLESLIARMGDSLDEY